MPILYYFLGRVLAHIGRRSVIASLVIGGFVICSNVLSVLPYKVLEPVSFSDQPEIKAHLGPNLNLTSYLWNYLNEIHQDYDGPVEGIVKYLAINARAGESVKTGYDSGSLLFYLPHLRIIPWADTGGDAPDWIVYRHHSVLRGRRKSLESIQNVKYEPVEIDYPDIPTENTPEPTGHHFSTVTNAPRVKIYRKVK